ncbi:esterase/lipase family protein [Nitrospirillum viridazoti]|uniref:Phospholipase n=1 Tax=Nitrospirillum viridazoti CBAmc TaxID=1441467 RepID=A0A248JPA1_9PROT|nr:phospholipase [Nitrospirillum amazonense]ASG20525.1 phospholipase [Nitrospirillum amazonense CBAmc]TWB34128.1 hypothetical protein FBZ91_11223 [Nitrospirillum amazonense]
MILVFVHGWSATSTATYGGLPDALAVQAALTAPGLNLTVVQIHLGSYVSFQDAVTMADVVRAFDRALRDALLPPGAPAGTPLPDFSCVTHSTGGPVVREWVSRLYDGGAGGGAGLRRPPLRHLVMLAPANHGSPLATLGKERVGRIKAFFNGVEPGERILDWLALGSADQWRLNGRWLDYDPVAVDLYPFVLTGQTIDAHFYDFLNSYLAEEGSDGVVRVAGANLNCLFLRLVETAAAVVNPHPHFDAQPAAVLTPDGGPRTPQLPLAFGVIPDASHSGDSLGIMGSVTPQNAAAKPVVAEILRCLQVDSPAAYGARLAALSALTDATQQAVALAKPDEGQRHSQLVFRIRDDQGDAVDDFDLYLLGGPDYTPDNLPKGFFVDRQRNSVSPNCLVYYLDYDVMAQLPGAHFGLRVQARPAAGDGFVGYAPVEFRTDGAGLAMALRPNQTTYVDVVLRRHVDRAVFRLGAVTPAPLDFKDRKPSGTDVDTP